MKQIHLTHIEHRGEKRLLVKFPYDSKLITLIKKIEGATFSNTHKSWHVADSTGVVDELRGLFDGVAVIEEESSKMQVVSSKKDAAAVGSQQSANEKLPTPNSKLQTVNIDIIDEKKIILRFPFAKEHVAKIKTLPLYYWHKEEKYWSFPYTANIKSEIENYFAQFGFEIECNFIKSKNKELKEKKNYSNDKKIPVEYLEMLTLKRYSLNTVDTYKTAFEGFINFYKTKEPAEISHQEINDYLLHLVEKRKVSASFQNQVINSIKFYYEKVLKLEKLPYINIERPFKEKTLPTVLSEEEIQRIINSIDNIKHKSIMLTLYSAGLRISELLNLKMSDIDSKRKAVIIKGAKVHPVGLKYK